VQPLVFGAAPWQAGEVSTFAITDINGAYAGTATYEWAVLEGGLWNLRREINAQGTQEIVVTDMSEPGFRPVQSTLVRIDNSGTEQVRTTFNGSEANLEITNKQNITTPERVSIPSDVRTQATLVMLVRALPLAEGYATRLNIFNPIVGRHERVTLTVADREDVTVPAGTFESWRIELESPDSETAVWVAVAAPAQVVKFTESRNGGLFELSEFTAAP
jgi:hypothetical protein